MIKKIAVFSGIVILAIVSGYVGHAVLAKQESVVETANAGSRSIEEIQAEQGKPVRVAQVEQKTIELSQTFYGTAVPYAEANVQNKYGGRLVQLNGKEGDAVEAGSLIVKLDDSDYRLQLEQALATKNSALQSVNQAESNLETAETDLKRYEQLLKDGFVSKQNVDSLRNQTQVAQANLQSAREQVKNADATIQILQNTLKDMKVTAPISGIIDEKNFNLNEIPGAEAVIYHIVDIDHIYIEVDVPESFISAIQEQMTVGVSFDSLKEQQFTGVIERIIPTGDRQSRNFTVKVLVENPDHLIKPGMFARINASLERIPNALVLDKKSLLKEGEMYYVFKASDGHAEKIAVDVKHRDGQAVAVFSNDLTPQDSVVIEGVRMLNPNDRINIL